MAVPSRLVILVLVLAIAVAFVLFTAAPPENPPAPGPDTVDGAGAGADPGSIGDASREKVPAVADPPRPRGAWHVQVLGPGDAPLAGARFARKGALSSRAETGADGWVVLPWSPESETLTVYLSGAAPDDQVVLTDRRTVLRYPDLLPLTVRVVDAVTGEVVLPERLSLYRRLGRDLPLRPGPRGFELSISHARAGHRADLAFLLETPPGYALPEAGISRVAVDVSRFATRLCATIVLHPEARVRVEVREPDGRPALGAEVRGAHMLGRDLAVASPPTGTDGTTWARGVPHLRGEELTLTASIGRRSAVSTPVRLGDLKKETLVRVVLPASPAPRGLRGRGASSAASSRMRISSAWHGSGKMGIRVIRRDGHSARDTLVEATMRREHSPLPWICEVRTNCEGWALIDNVPSGTASVTVLERGFLAPVPSELEIRSGETSKLTIQEEAPRTARLRVLDEAGVPVPGAEVMAAVGDDPNPWPMLEGGTQILNIFTDPDGRASIPNLPATGATVNASYGSRLASAPADGEEEIILRLGLEGDDHK